MTLKIKSVSSFLLFFLWVKSLSPAIGSDTSFQEKCPQMLQKVSGESFRALGLPSRLFLTQSTTPPQKALGLLTPYERKAWRWRDYALFPVAFPFWWTRFATQLIPRQFGYELSPGNFVRHTLTELPFQWLTKQPVRLRKWLTVPIGFGAGLYLAGEVIDASVNFIKQDIINVRANEAIKKKIEENPEIWDERIDSHFLYEPIKVLLKEGKIDRELARQHAVKFFKTYEKYLNQEDSNVFEKTEPELDEILKEMLFSHTEKLVKSGKEPGYLYIENKPEVTREQKAQLIALQSERLKNFQRIEVTMGKLAKGEKLTEKENSWFASQLSSNPFVKGVLLKLAPPTMQVPGIPTGTRGLRLGKNENGKEVRRYFSKDELIYYLQYFTHIDTKRQEDQVLGRAALVSSSSRRTRAASDDQQEIIERIKENSPKIIVEE